MEFKKVAQKQENSGGQGAQEERAPARDEPQNQNLESEAENQETKPRKEMHAIKHQATKTILLDARVCLTQMRNLSRTAEPLANSAATARERYHRRRWYPCSW